MCSSGSVVEKDSCSMVFSRIFLTAGDDGYGFVEFVVGFGTNDHSVGPALPAHHDDMTERGGEDIDGGPPFV